MLRQLGLAVLVRNTRRTILLKGDTAASGSYNLVHVDLNGAHEYAKHYFLKGRNYMQTCMLDNP